MITIFSIIGSGNASTQSSCGKGQNTKAGTVTGTYAQGDSISVTFARVNGHGGSAADVQIRLSMTTTGVFDPATATDLTAGGKLTMDTGVNGPQTGKVTLPSGSTGAGVLQFIWNAQDGSKWYDCADIMITPPADPAVCTKKSPACQDICTPVQTGVCSCKSGRYPTVTDASTCADLPPSVDLMLNVKGKLADSYTLGNGNTMTPQDYLTYNLEAFKGLKGRISYSSSTYNADNSTTTLYFSVLSDPTTGASGQSGANTILSYVSATGPTSVGAFPLQIALAVEPQANTQVTAGAGFTPINPNTNASDRKSVV